MDWFNCLCFCITAVLCTFMLCLSFSDFLTAWQNIKSHEPTGKPPVPAKDE